MVERRNIKFVPARFGRRDRDVGTPQDGLTLTEDLKDRLILERRPFRATYSRSDRGIVYLEKYGYFEGFGDGQPVTWYLIGHFTLDGARPLQFNYMSSSMMDAALAIDGWDAFLTDVIRHFEIKSVMES